jgi:hypothetical protein
VAASLWSHFPLKYSNIDVKNSGDTTLDISY